ncbi:MAG: hypothetical protein NUV63_12315 [Gallionella sp.]|nr:hypothetical protein [Gallionella sp.]
MPTLTITLTAQQYARGATAIGKDLNLGRDATAEECRQYVIAMLRSVVLAREKDVAVEALVPATFDPI